MTIEEALTNIDAVKPNSFTPEQMKDWLYNLDLKIYKEVISQHDMTGIDEFEGYDSETPETTTLLVPEPYSKLYTSYLESKIDYYNGEFARYNNTATMFNADYDEYTKWYIRDHMPNAVDFKWR